MKYVLVDYENVQENNLEPLLSAGYAVTIFAGDLQAKIPTSMMLLQQKYKDSFWLEQIVGNGKNALDFHIAFVLGQLFQEEPKNECIIISKDTGFDPLIAKICKHYGKKSCCRVASTDAIIPVKKDATPKPVVKKVEQPQKKTAPSMNADALIKLLKKAKPKNVSGLENSIASWAKQKKLNVDAKSLIKALQDKGKIKVSPEGKITYVNK